MEKLSPNSIPIIYSETIYRLKKPTVLTGTESSSTPRKVPKQTYASQIPFEGNNNNGVLILNFESGHKYISQNNQIFLSKIIGATKNELSDCALVNAYGKKIDLESLSDTLNAKNIITFGVNLFDVGIKNTAPLNYECSNIPSGLTIIPADKLTVISNTPDKKKALWIALQRMFTI